MSNIKVATLHPMSHSHVGSQYKDTNQGEGFKFLDSHLDSFVYFECVA